MTKIDINMIVGSSLWGLLMGENHDTEEHTLYRLVGWKALNLMHSVEALI